MLEAFRKVAVQAKQIKADQKKEKDDAEKRRLEILRKKRERDQEEAAKPAITELTDEEADKLQKEIAAERYIFRCDSLSWNCVDEILFYFLENLS